jgi:hypothetical protein
MKRGDKTIVFVDLLGFARLTEDWPHRIIHRRRGSLRTSSTSDSSNRLMTFHNVLDQTIQEFARMSNVITAMSFSDCAFVLVGNSYLSAEFAAELMQHYVRAYVPVRMGIAAGTFWPGRQSSDVIGGSVISRAIFYGTAIVQAHRAESSGLAGMRIFLHQSLDGVPNFGPRPILRFPVQTNGVFGELSYLYHRDQYRNVSRPESIDADDDALWVSVADLRSSVDKKAPRRAHRQYVETLAALNRMRRALGRPQFKNLRRA